VAPAPPVGTYLKDGYQYIVMIGGAAGIPLWISAEGGGKPPGLDGGEKINITSMHNKVMRTFVPRHLITLDDSTMTAFYDPKVLNNLLALINVQTVMTAYFPDGSSWSWWGALTKFIPGELKEGTAPTAEVTLIATNRDPSAGN
jgi:hypothetical protein